MATHGVSEAAMPMLTGLLFLPLFVVGTREEEHASEAISEPLLKVDDDAKTVIDKAVKIYGGEKRGRLEAKCFSPARRGKAASHRKEK